MDMANDKIEDEFSYLTRNDFTSEIFKLELTNIPRNLGIAKIKKKMINMGLKPCKVKCVTGRDYAFVTFRCEEDKNKAFELLEGCIWKNKQIKIKSASANPDPLFVKRKSNDGKASLCEIKKQKLCNTVSISEKLNDVVTPLWKMPYDEQIQSKNSCLQLISKKLTKLIEKNNQDDKQIIMQQKSINNGLCFQLNNIISSKIINGYRNKSEFTIGKNFTGEDYEVGFRIGSYKGGDLSVVAPDFCHHICEKAKYVANFVKCYLRSSSKKSSFDASLRTGHWMQATVRCTKSCSNLCLILCMHPQNLTQDEISQEKEKLRDYLIERNETKITCVYLQLESDRKEVYEESKCLHIFGEKYIEETLNGYNFRISPLSFFQVNTESAETLYNTIGEMFQPSPEDILLDICCGTGSIGISLANKFKKVYGIELCMQAIEDAKYNVQANEITNVELINGRVEDELGKLLRSISGDNIVAVVDPPRAGLHTDVVKVIRKSASIKKLIYVSCKYKAALQNLTDLTRQASNRILGKPFHVKQVSATDLFPLTEHFETVLLLDRT